jgi:hypothetical protein
LTGPAGSYQIRTTRARAGAGAFEPPRTISTGAEGAGYPAVALDGQGTLYVVWEVFPAPRERPRGLAISVSTDNGASFAPPRLVPGSRDGGGGTNGSHQGLLGKKLAASANGKGRIAVINSSLHQPDRSRVWLMRGHLVR